jgi:hypothetical protein
LITLTSLRGRRRFAPTSARISVGELLWLLEHADMEMQFQAMAALRSLRAEVWAEGSDPDLCWSVHLPVDAPETPPRRIKPEHQLDG